MFHNESAKRANSIGEQLKNIIDGINAGNKLDESLVALTLMITRLALSIMAEELESATHCPACHAELHRACSNCDTWDFNRE